MSNCNKPSVFGFDTRWIGDHGIGRFAREIFNRCDGIEALHLKGSPSSPLDPLKSAFWLMRNRHRQFFTPGYNAPLFATSRSLFILHDLNHIDLEDSRRFAISLYYRYVIRRACKKALYVLTVSEFSRKRILEWSGIDDSRVVNVGNGVSDIFTSSPGMQDNSLLNSRIFGHQQAFPFFLCVSNRRSHKNEERLLQAFASARLGTETRLVMTGEKTPRLDEYIESLGISQRVILVGNVDDDTLAALYRGARALLFPSLYEGFGLPVIEAMASGTPVMTSTCASLPEIAGDAAWLVDPLDIDAMADVISTLAVDDALCQRLAQLGLERAGHFRWEKVASRVQNVLWQCADIRD